MTGGLGLNDFLIQSILYVLIYGQLVSHEAQQCRHSLEASEEENQALGHHVIVLPFCEL